MSWPEKVISKKNTPYERGWNKAIDFYSAEVRRRAGVDEIQAVIKRWHMKHAGYFVTNKMQDDITLAQAISAHMTEGVE